MLNINFRGSLKPHTTIYKLGGVFGLAGLAFLFAALMIYLPVKHTSVPFWIVLSLGVLCVAAFCFIRSEQVIHAIRSRQALYGMNVGVAVILAIGIAIVVNVIVDQLFDKELDWTADKVFTLSEQTKKILHSLSQEIQIVAFFSSAEATDNSQRQYKNARELLEMYSRESQKIKLTFVDPIANPLKRQEYNIEFNGTTVFDCADTGKRESVTTVDEQKFTSAIMKVTREEIKKIYFLSGHDENSINDYERQGFNRAKEALEKQNYQVEELFLGQQPEIPNDCSVLVIVNPKSPLSEHELDVIKKYLDESMGKALIMLDPSVPTDEHNSKLIQLLAEWGVAVNNDLVVDLELAAFIFPVGRRIEIPLIKDFEYHPITKDVRPVPFALARSVAPIEKTIPDVTVKSLVKTTSTEGFSWGETNRDESGNFIDDNYTQGKDTPAPVSLAVAVQREREQSSSEEEESTKQTDTRLVVFGDSDFASKQHFDMSGGGDLFLNAINWLMMEEDLISIRPEPPQERAMTMISARNVWFVWFASIFAIPIAVFILGVVVWWKRR